MNVDRQIGEAGAATAAQSSTGRSPVRDSEPNVVVCVAPQSGRHESLKAAVVAGGGELGSIGEADALVWADPAVPHEFPATLAQGPNVRWVALPFAGIEPYADYLTDRNGDHDMVWTAAKGVYAEPVAEHVVATALAGMRGLVHYSRETTWAPPVGRNLLGARVTVFGAGGITDSLVRLLGPFNCDITVVRRQADPYPGATRTVALADRLDALADTDLVVLALALTPETRGVISDAELAAMPDHAWLVNVARGGHIDTDALVCALDAGSIGGAALDVTDPEPLPDGHPLWGQPRVLITPHVGNTPEMGIPLLARHIEQNVARFRVGDELDGVIDTSAGY